MPCGKWSKCKPNNPRQRIQEVAERRRYLASLTPRQRLEEACWDDLLVVYWGKPPVGWYLNGAGKSLYSRVLKKRTGDTDFQECALPGLAAGWVWLPDPAFFKGCAPGATVEQPFCGEKPGSPGKNWFQYLLVREYEVGLVQLGMHFHPGVGKWVRAAQTAQPQLDASATGYGGQVDWEVAGYQPAAPVYLELDGQWCPCLPGVVTPDNTYPVVGGLSLQALGVRILNPPLQPPTDEDLELAELRNQVSVPFQDGIPTPPLSSPDFGMVDSAQGSSQGTPEGIAAAPGEYIDLTASPAPDVVDLTDPSVSGAVIANADCSFNDLFEGSWDPLWSEEELAEFWQFFAGLNWAQRDFVHFHLVDLDKWWSGSSRELVAALRSKVLSGEVA
ncbi:hypothetical protein EK21DRAFT_114798 [Setomelanomma holmii]|uniref:Uncharacterized protein n=1 Tax=Setomelanomma holmii TaxID=210430 RepID=A0A9P4H5P2_9PLEO|nr:hypothetical protein EK21DRAFT_114798 [Setomelanomma holmii]